MPVDLSRTLDIPGLGGGGGGGTVTVAAVNALASSRSGADFVCDSVDDQVEINNAIAALPAAGGSVQLSEGDFHLGAAIDQSLAATVALRGVGRQYTAPGGTSLLRDGPAGSYPILLLRDGSRSELADMTLSDSAAVAHSQPLIVVDTAADASLLVRNIYAENDTASGSVLSLGSGSVIVHDSDLQSDGVVVALTGSPNFTARDSFFYGFTSGYAIDWDDSANPGGRLALYGCDVDGGGGGLRFHPQSPFGEVVIDGGRIIGAGSGNDILHLVNLNALHLRTVLLGDNACGGLYLENLGQSASTYTDIDVVLQAAGTHGVRLKDVTRARVRAVVLNASLAADNTYSGVFVEGNSDQNDIAARVYHDTTWGANQPLYGLRIDASTCDKNNVHDSILIGASKTGGNEFSDAGTGTTSSNVITT